MVDEVPLHAADGTTDSAFLPDNMPDFAKQLALMDDPNAMPRPRVETSIAERQAADSAALAQSGSAAGGLAGGAPGLTVAAGDAAAKPRWAMVDEKGRAAAVGRRKESEAQVRDFIQGIPAARKGVCDEDTLLYRCMLSGLQRVFYPPANSKHTTNAALLSDVVAQSSSTCWCIIDVHILWCGCRCCSATALAAAPSTAGRSRATSPRPRIAQRRCSRC